MMAPRVSRTEDGPQSTGWKAALLSRRLTNSRRSIGMWTELPPTQCYGTEYTITSSHIFQQVMSPGRTLVKSITYRFANHHNLPIFPLRLERRLSRVLLFHHPPHPEPIVTMTDVTK
jgi:hypothetical protein